MEITLKHILIAFAAILILLVFTLQNISNFMIEERKCESGFAVINKCGCLPDDNLSILLGQDPKKNNLNKDFVDFTDKIRNISHD